MTFKTFTRKKFYTRGKPIDAPTGELAADIQKEENFPKTSSVDKLILFFADKNDDVKKAFVDAVSEYIKNKLEIE